VHILQIFKMALKSLVSNRLRSFLTMLGIIIGVAAVIVALGLMDGIYKYNIQSYNDMGANIVTLNVKNTGTRRITVDAMYQLYEKHPDTFQGFSPLVEGTFTLKKNAKSLKQKTVSGVNEGYAELKNLQVKKGRFITYGDILVRNKICVIGTFIKKKLFHKGNVLGNTLIINGEEYTIVGVLKEKDKGREYSLDDCVYIPYSTATRLAGSVDTNTFLFGTYGTVYIDQAEKIIGNAVYDVMKDNKLYKLSSWSYIMVSVKQEMLIVKMVAGFIAGISLAVAGIGIMNIMLVSVVERTKEIGIRKALGAKHRDIMRQFIIEAITLSGFSGIIGILLGKLISMLVGNAVGVDASPAISSVLLSFGVSVSIGIIFGYIPAKRAAKLNPIDALRSE
jgi:putative ABC transport system permease protein